MLHIVNKSPSQTRTLDSCLRLAQDGSARAADRGRRLCRDPRQRRRRRVCARPAARLQVYALQPDCDARGMTAMLAEGITLVDYGGFVDLVAQHTTTHSWL